jgi:hypothetical protein
MTAERAHDDPKRVSTHARLRALVSKAFPPCAVERPGAS